MSITQELKPIVQKSIMNLGPNMLKDAKGSINVFYHLRMKILLGFINAKAGRKFETSEEIKQFVSTLTSGDRIKYAFLLLLIDYISNSIMLVILIKVLPKSLGKKVYELNMRLAAIIAKRTLSDKKVQENADKILQILSDQSRAFNYMNGRLWANNSEPEVIKKTLDKAAPFMGNMLLSAGIAASLNEEASKRAALELGLEKEYFAVFNAFEFTQYVIGIARQGVASLKQGIALRLITVAVHAGLTGLHRIGFHGTATVAHFLHNTFALGIQEIYAMLTNNVALSEIAKGRVLEDKIREAQSKYSDKIESKITDDSTFSQALKNISDRFNFNK